MIDLDITIKRLEDLTREVARIEFSHDFGVNAVECAIKARKEVESLIYELRGLEIDDDEC